MQDRLTRSRLLVAGIVVAFAAAACGGSTTGDNAGAQGLEGEIRVSGSSTVEPISALVAEKFQAENPGVSISVAGPGTSDGFAQFCAGEVQVNDASRPIDPEEIAACKKEGIGFVELKVAIDGLTVLTSPQNTAIGCLGFADLYALLGPESKGFQSWSDANGLAEEIGAAHAPYPDMPLVITGPGEESGTWGSLIDLALGDIGEERGFDDVATRPDYQATANDNVIVQGIQGSDSSLGWVGYAFYRQTQGATRAIPIDNGKGDCVEPTEETIASGEYPLARDLFIYVNAEEAENDPAVAAFVDFYLSEEGLASVPEVGYVSQPSEDLGVTFDTWSNKTVGTVAQ